MIAVMSASDRRAAPGRAGCHPRRGHLGWAYYVLSTAGQYVAAHRLSPWVRKLQDELGIGALGHRGPAAQLIAVSVVLYHHVARCFQRGAVYHDVAADQQAGAVVRQPPVCGDELVGRRPATVGEVLAVAAFASRFGRVMPLRRVSGSYSALHRSAVRFSFYLASRHSLEVDVCRTYTSYSSPYTTYSCQRRAEKRPSSKVRPGPPGANRRPRWR